MSQIRQLIYRQIWKVSGISADKGKHVSVGSILNQFMNFRQATFFTSQNYTLRINHTITLNTDNDNENNNNNNKHNTKIHIAIISPGNTMIRLMYTQINEFPRSFRSQ